MKKNAYKVMTEYLGDEQHIGNIETEEIIRHPQHVIVLDQQLYGIDRVEVKPEGRLLYVFKIQAATLDSSETVDDINKKPLEDVMNFLHKHEVSTSYYTFGVQLGLERSDEQNPDREFAVTGDTLILALVKLRNEMIERKLIQRGEW